MVWVDRLGRGRREGRREGEKRGERERGEREREKRGREGGRSLHSNHPCCKRVATVYQDRLSLTLQKMREGG